MADVGGPATPGEGALWVSQQEERNDAREVKPSRGDPVERRGGRRRDGCRWGVDEGDRSHERCESPWYDCDGLPEDDPRWSRRCSKLLL